MMAKFGLQLIVAFLCLVVCGFQVHGFIPNTIRERVAFTTDSTTHMEMTENAHRAMAVIYMNDYPARYPDQVVAMSTSDFKTAVKHFRKGVEAPDLNALKDVNEAHVDAESFVNASIRLTVERDKVIRAILANSMAYARDLTGQLFHTLQDFYSHSNWIEIYGATINPGWGVPGASIGTIAPTTQATCIDCDTPRSTCVDNIIPSTDLTSGYVKIFFWGDAGPFKPHPGKCSHGGVLDDTLDIPATGGINKDSLNSLLSPHHYLHREAARAAEDDTLEWFKALRKSASEAQYAQYLGLEFASSLCFVVDTTGSMSNDIAAVKAVTSAITAAADTDKIKEFVLSEFNDPGFGPALMTNSPVVMLAAINGLTASGGGDFSELAYHGMDLALNLVKPGSACYVFTDATAKDAHMKPAIIAKALAINVAIFIFYTGPGSFIGKRDIAALENRHRRAIGTDPLSNTALVTGGQLMIVTKDTIDEAVTLVETGLTTLKVTILQMDGLLVSGEFEIPIDETLTDVVIVVSATNTINSVTFKDATDADQFPSNLIDIVTLKVYTIPDPSDGIWTVSVDVIGEYSLQVTAKSIADFTYSFVEEHLEGHTGYLDIEGKPLAGEEAIIVADVFGSFNPVTGDPLIPGLANVTDLAIVEMDGTEVQRHELFELAELKRYEVKTMLPLTDFRLVFEGEDSSGNKLQRWESALLSTAESILNVVLDAVGGLSITPGEELEVSLSITNLGLSGTYNLAVSDSLDFFVSVAPSFVTLDFNETETAVVKFSAPLDAKFGQVTTVSVTAVRTSGDDENFIVFYISVASLIDDTTPPVCTITGFDGDCSLTRSGGECEEETWSIVFSVEDSGAGLHLVKPSVVHVGATLDISFASGINDAIGGTYTSDCCMPRVAIIATDVLGNSDSGDACTVDYVPAGTNRECQMSMTGSITTFDGASGFPDLEMPSGVKSLVSKTTMPNTDICKYQVKAVTNDDGQIDWLAISVGVHSNPNKHKRNFAFDRANGKVEMRGQGLSGPDVLTLPFTWTHNGLTIDITGNSSDWHLSSSPCSYHLNFGPDGPEPAFRLTVGNELMDKVEGICGDFDGDADNDHA